MPKNSGGKYCKIPCPVCSGKNKMSYGAKSCWQCRYESFRTAVKRCTKCNLELNENNWLPFLRGNKYNICNECFNRESREKYKTRRVWYKNKNQKLKKKVVDHYGGKCACCGVEDLVFLTIDHVENDGNIHRSTINGKRGKNGNLRGGGASTYKWIIDNKYPDGFQVLCFNCNWAKSHGGCPHQGPPVEYEDKVIVSYSKTYKCLKCEKEFDHHSKFASHMRYKHPQNE